MRILLLFFLSLLGFPLLAQSTTPAVGEGWAISFTSFSRRPTREAFQTFVTAPDTVARMLEPGVSVRPGFSFPPRQTDTLTLDGVPTPYFLDDAFSESSIARPVRFHTFQVRAHFRNAKGFDFSTGFEYSDQSFDYERASFPVLTDDLFYQRIARRRTRIGIPIGLTYHFFNQRRLQPYAGIRAFYALTRSEVSDNRLVSPTRSDVFAVPINERFRQQTVFEMGMWLLAGLSYQVSNRWSFAAELTQNSLSHDSFLADAGLILRYHFGPNKRGEATE